MFIKRCLQTSAITCQRAGQRFKLEGFPKQPEPTQAQIADATRLFARPVKFIKSISKANQADELTNPEVKLFLVRMQKKLNWFN